MAPVRMILVGGFLGSGKTTLVARAADRLIARGRRVGLITNDQAANLVDTELLRRAGHGVREVAGACFCCGFAKLIDSADELIAEFQPDVLLAEPVGSCADLAATVVRPIQTYCADRITPAPFTVLAEPRRLAEALARRVGQALRETEEAERFPDSVLYVFRKQLEEADVIAVSKSDTLTAGQAEALRVRTADAFGCETFALSAQEDVGVEAWLDHVLKGDRAGERTLEIDYDTYAAGEAELGWLNAHVALEAGHAETDWAGFCLALLADVQRRCASSGAAIGHVKVLLQAGGGSIAGNATDTRAAPRLRGQLPPDAPRADLTVNARAALAPELLADLLGDALRVAAGDSVTWQISEATHFRPARPNPTYRIEEVR